MSKSLKDFQMIIMEYHANHLKQLESTEHGFMFMGGTWRFVSFESEVLSGFFEAIHCQS